MSKISEQFGKLKSIVLKQLGREEFEKDTDGKAILSKDDEDTLKSAFTPAFIEKFKQGLDTEAALEDEKAEHKAAIDQLNSDNANSIMEMQQKVNAAEALANAERQKAERLAAEKVALQEAVDVLSEMPGADDAELLKLEKGGVQGASKDAWLGVKPNMKHFHTAMAAEALEGDTAKVMMSSDAGFTTNNVAGAAGNTINIDELYSEFGTYLSAQGAKLEILLKLVQKTESQNYMTTKMAITEWRASEGLITSVVQQFVAKWTPLGKSTFKPLTIKNRRHKINLPITPDEINDSWLSYLYDEGVTVDKMPVTRYIIEQLLRPRIEQDIELLMIATGEYTELGEVSEGDAGQATGKSMDGYVTILTQQKALGAGSDMNFFTLVDGATELTKDNIVDQIEAYADWVEETAPMYAKVGMNIFIDPNLYKWFKRGYRELYPTSKNEDKNQDKPDFSNLTFVPLAAMRGTGVFFSTPKDNFIRLIHKNQAGGATKLYMQVDNYTVKVFGEFWLGVGFALAELVFGYVPESDASGSGV